MSQAQLTGWDDVAQNFPDVRCREPGCLGEARYRNLELCSYHYAQRYQHGTRVERSCTACGQAFWLPNASYHRKRCWECLPRTQTGVRVEVVCFECGKGFEITPGEKRDREKRGLNYYCGNPCVGKIKPWANGGMGHRCITADGYVNIYVPPEERDPNRRGHSTDAEHRVVMRRILGRHLEPHETVHHINGDRADNRPENLQLRTGRHGKGFALKCRCCGSSDVEYVELA